MEQSHSVNRSGQVTACSKDYFEDLEILVPGRKVRRRGVPLQLGVKVGTGFQ